MRYPLHFFLRTNGLDCYTMSVMIMNGWGVSVVMVSWEKNMIFLGSTGETRILRPYRKLYWSQSFFKASSFMYDLGE